MLDFQRVKEVLNEIGIELTGLREKGEIGESMGVILKGRVNDRTKIPFGMDARLLNAPEIVKQRWMKYQQYGKEKAAGRLAERYAAGEVLASDHEHDEPVKFPEPPEPRKPFVTEIKFDLTNELDPEEFKSMVVKRVTPDMIELILQRLSNSEQDIERVRNRAIRAAKREYKLRERVDELERMLESTDRGLHEGLGQRVTDLERHKHASRKASTDKKWGWDVETSGPYVR